MRIGIVGEGRVGKTLGTAWTKAGHDVVYGARDAQVGGGRVRVEELSSKANVVVLAVPWTAVTEVLDRLGDLRGKPLVDATNPLASDGSLLLGHTTSGGEHVAAAAKNARVVKAFHSTGFENMAAPVFGSHRAMMPVAGDDASAVGVVASLAADIGFEGLPLKGLARARELEPLAALWIDLAMRKGQGRNMAFAVSRRSAKDAVKRDRTAAPKRIVVVGSGNIGGALARAWLEVGHHVRIAARDTNAQDVRDLAALGAEIGEVPNGARDTDVVVFAIPAGAVASTAATLGDLRGKVVVDCTNAIGKGFTLQ